MEEEIATEFASSILGFLMMIYTHFTLRAMYLGTNYTE